MKFRFHWAVLCNPALGIPRGKQEYGKKSTAAKAAELTCGSAEMLARLLFLAAMALSTLPASCTLTLSDTGRAFSPLTSPLSLCCCLPLEWKMYRKGRCAQENNNNKKQVLVSSSTFTQGAGNTCSPLRAVSVFHLRSC